MGPRVQVPLRTHAANNRYSMFVRSFVPCNAAAMLMMSFQQRILHLTVGTMFYDDVDVDVVKVGNYVHTICKRCSSGDGGGGGAVCSSYVRLHVRVRGAGGTFVMLSLGLAVV